MSVKILSREYINPFRSEKTDWLLGNVGDWLRAKFLVEAGVDFLATNENPLTLNTEEKTITLMNGKKWSDYGFDVGNTVTMQYVVQTTLDDGSQTSEPVNFDFTIVQLYGDIMVYDDAGPLAVLGFDMIPTERASIRIYAVKLYVDEDLEGLLIKYNHISNGEISNNVLDSFIDGGTTEAIYNGLAGLSSNVVDMELMPNQSGMAIESVKVRKVTSSSGANSAFFTLENKVIDMSFDAIQYNKTAESIQLNKVSGPGIYHSSVNGIIPKTTPGLGTYTNGISGQMIIDNADFDGARYLNIDMFFKIITNNNGGNQNRLRLQLFKYNNGVAYDFVEKTELGIWHVTNEIRGVLLHYLNILTLNVQEGESYSLGFEFTANGSSLVTRTIRFQTISGNVNVLEAITDTGYKKQYEIELNFMLASFFQNWDDILNGIPPQIIFDAGSLTDNIEIKFLPEWNNPNIFIKNDPQETERQGNTGWFNENFNGLQNDFQVKEIGYFDLGGAPVASLSYGQETKVRAVISGIQNLTLNASSFQYGFIWTPTDEIQYKNKPTSFQQNTKINSPTNQSFLLGQNNAFTYVGFSEDGLNRMDVHDVSFTQNGNDVVFEAIFKPTPEFTSFFDGRVDDRNYSLWASVADSTLTTNFSNRVNLILDTNKMDYFIPVSGELPGVTNKFIEHPEAETVPGVDLYIGFLEDDILSRSYFPLNVNDRLNQIIMGYEVQNVVSGETFELDRFAASLSQYVTDVNGVQQLNLQTERGFKFVPLFNKNWVRVMRNSTLDAVADVPNNIPARSGYQILFGAKIRWEHWLAKFLSLAAQSEFFNAGEPLNGFNQNWLGYLRAGQHKVNYFILFDVLSNGILTRYKNAFEITFDGYDENTIIETEHKYYNNATDVEMSAGTDAETGRPVGMILSNEKTRIEITYTRIDGDFDLDNLYSVTTLEIDGGPGVMQHRQLSSIIGSEFDNPLIPISGQTKLQIIQDDTNVVRTVCLVDNTKLQSATRYKITGRIGCFANSGGAPIETQIYENKYVNQYQ